MNETKTQEQNALSTVANATNGVILTDEQQLALNLICTWFLSSPNQQYKLGGYAGTGKTTIIKTLLSSLACNKVVCAFTGKACNVLQRKGIYAQTIHSLIYDCYQDPQTKQWHFDKKSTLPGNPKLIIVDEASMLSTELFNDLKAYGKKLLFVGDPGQLEPVGDNPNLMLQCDNVLSKIHRQAESSPIITLAGNVRTNQGGCLTHRNVGGELIIKSKTITPENILAASQLICAKNLTRQAFNKNVRAAKGQVTPTPVIGDKIIVLRNNLSFSVFNGMILFIDSIEKETAESWECNVHDELNHTFKNLPIWKTGFLGVIKKDTHIPKKYVYCDYAYAITCHKSQGSEWDHVIVFDEWMPPQVWDMARWRYTAITRAAKKLTYLI